MHDTGSKTKCNTSHQDETSVSAYLDHPIQMVKEAFYNKIRAGTNRSGEVDCNGECSVQCAVCSVQCGVCSVQCAVCSV